MPGTSGRTERAIPHTSPKSSAKSVQVRAAQAPHSSSCAGPPSFDATKSAARAASRKSATHVRAAPAALAVASLLTAFG
jgi:hypothetical protein